MITEINVTTGEGVIPIQVIRSRRKSLGLEIKQDLSVRVRIPAKTPDCEVMQFIDNHKTWILEKYRVIEGQAKSRQENPIPLPTKAGQKAIMEKFTKRVSSYEAEMGVHCSKITIRNQKTRWGSCSSKGNLNFNYKLAFMPEEILDYVVVHELAHLRYMNHSRDFWDEVAKYIPDYVTRRRWLKEHGGEY